MPYDVYQHEAFHYPRNRGAPHDRNRDREVRDGLTRARQGDQKAAIERRAELSGAVGALVTHGELLTDLITDPRIGWLMRNYDTIYGLIINSRSINGDDDHDKLYAQSSINSIQVINKK